MAQDHLLLAFDEDTLKIVMTAIFGVFWLVAQFMSGRDQVKRRPPVKQKPQPVAPNVAPGRQVAVGQANAPKKQNTLEEALRREVDEFLKRAQGGQPQQERQPAKQARPRRETSTVSQPVQRKPLSRTGDKPTRQTSAPARTLAKPLREISSRTPQQPESAPAPDAGGVNWGGSVSEHVAQHLGGQDLSQRAERLGATVSHADERIEEHLHEVFDHQLGSLGVQATETEPKPKRSSAAQDIVKLIREPGGMRQLIIANEILRRPDDRF